MFYESDKYVKRSAKASLERTMDRPCEKNVFITKRINSISNVSRKEHERMAKMRCLKVSLLIVLHDSYQRRIKKENI